MRLGSSSSHTVWDKLLTPAVTVDPGATVTLDVANASGGQIGRNSGADALAALDFSRVNPVTGPIAVRGAEPGDALIVDILDIVVDEWGWTGCIPGFGLLADQFLEAHLRISTITAEGAQLLPGLTIPVAPMIGTIGVAPAEPGPHPMLPPHRNGGNMDIRHVTAGSHVALPVAVGGALLSLGDTHAAQGDGEVCGTGIETSSTVTIRIDLEKNRNLPTPLLRTDGRSRRGRTALVTTGIGPDLFDAARDATRFMIDEIVRRTGLAAVDAYLLASVAADLRVSEIVDLPNVVVSMHLDEALL